MSIAAPSRRPDALGRVEHGPTEALIEEARERARRRRRLYGIAAGAAAIAGVAAIVGFNGAGSSPARRAALDPTAESPVGDLGVFEPSRGWIVFPDGTGISAVDPDDPSSRRTVLDNHVAFSAHVSPVGWSADGTKLVLEDEGESGTWILDSTGSLHNVRAADGCCCFVPARQMSPDDISTEAGGGAVWSTADGTTFFVPLAIDVVLIDSDPTRLPEPPYIATGHTAWSPDGEQLLLTAPGDQTFSWLPTNPPDTQGLYVTTVDGATTRRISAGSYLAAVWSADGTQIAAINVKPQGRSLVTMNADGTDSRVLIELDADEFTGIAWHPLAPHHD